MNIFYSGSKSYSSFYSYFLLPLNFVIINTGFGLTKIWFIIVIVESSYWVHFIHVSAWFSWVHFTIEFQLSCCYLNLVLWFYFFFFYSSFTFILLFFSCCKLVCCSIMLSHGIGYWISQTESVWLRPNQLRFLRISVPLAQVPSLSFHLKKISLKNPNLKRNYIQLNRTEHHSTEWIYWMHWMLPFRRADNLQSYFS